MKVTMLVDTQYNGPVRIGDTLNVPDDVARRWQKNRIASIDEYQDQADKPIERMSVAELRERVVALGLYVDGTERKPDLVRMLSAYQS